MVCSVYYDYGDNDRDKRPRLDPALSPPFVLSSDIEERQKRPLLSD